jgi:hypothetical protein
VRFREPIQTRWISDGSGIAGNLAASLRAVDSSGREVAGDRLLGDFPRGADHVFDAPGAASRTYAPGNCGNESLMGHQLHFDATWMCATGFAATGPSMSPTLMRSTPGSAKRSL